MKTGDISVFEAEFSVGKQEMNHMLEHMLGFSVTDTARNGS